METVLYSVLAGACGGALFGLKGYLEARVGEKAKFDFSFFAKSLFTPILVGLLAGLLSANPTEAFAAGMLGKGMQELYSAYKK